MLCRKGHKRLKLKPCGTSIGQRIISIDHALQVERGKSTILIMIYLLFSTGCERLQVNIPVEVQPVKREEAALLVLVENRSTRHIKITYPVSISMLRQNQHTVFQLSQPGNHKIVVTAYAEDPNYRDVYNPVVTIEISVFLNGYGVIRAKEKFVGYYLEITDGMLLQNK